MVLNSDISGAMTIQLEEVFNQLPQIPEFVKGIRRAPARNFTLSPKETVLALRNALRYIPEKWHTKLAPEFLDELKLKNDRVVQSALNTGYPLTNHIMYYEAYYNEKI